MFRKLLFVCMFFASSMLFATSLKLTNDSTYNLKVVIYSYDGEQLYETEVEKGKTVKWDDSYKPKSSSQSKHSITPLTVTWLRDEDVFSSCKGVHSGASISATSCAKR